MRPFTIKDTDFIDEWWAVRNRNSRVFSSGYLEVSHRVFGLRSREVGLTDQSPASSKSPLARSRRAIPFGVMISSAASFGPPRPIE